MYFCVKSIIGTLVNLAGRKRALNPTVVYSNDRSKIFKSGSPGVSLTLCCFVVYSTRQFVLSLVLCNFVLIFFNPFSILITSLGVERANLCSFRTFVRFAFVWFCLFPLLLCVLDGLRLVIVALTDFFSYLFCVC